MDRNASITKGPTGINYADIFRNLSVPENEIDHFLAKQPDVCRWVEAEIETAKSLHLPVSDPRVWMEIAERIASLGFPEVITGAMFAKVWYALVPETDR